MSSNRKYFLCCPPRQAVGPAVDMPVIRQAMTPMWRHCNVAVDKIKIPHTPSLPTPTSIHTYGVWMTSFLVGHCGILPVPFSVWPYGYTIFLKRFATSLLLRAVQFSWEYYVFSPATNYRLEKAISDDIAVFTMHLFVKSVLIFFINWELHFV